MAVRACLTCGDQPLLRPSCHACGGSGKRSAPTTKRAAKPAPAANATAEWYRGIAAQGPEARNLAAVEFCAPPNRDLDEIDALLNLVRPTGQEVKSAARAAIYEESLLSPVMGVTGALDSLGLPPKPGPFTSPLEALQRVWGYESFRPGQREIVETVMSGQDLLAVAPTSFGKSVCFQLPALLRQDRPVLVISPLIALMRDQVQQALGRGIPAVAVTSQNTPAENRRILANLHRTSLIYAAPERLDNGNFAQALSACPPWLVALDESHSVGSEAGLAYRPAYRFVEEFLRGAQRPQWLGLTASATPDTIDDIRERLGLQRAKLVRLSCDRPNLRYRVEHVTVGQKLGRLAAILKQHRGGGAAIVYCAFRKDCEELVAPFLQRELGVAVRHYHAGMKAPERREVEGLFFGRRLDVVVATCAFGMGIDRPDVRCVVMHGMPKSVEDFYQSVGRGGRDGEVCQAVALYDAREDLRKRRWLIQNGRDLEKNQYTTERGWTDDKFKDAQERQLDLLDECDKFLRSRFCRSQLLRRYFGEEPGAPCGTCDNCAAART